MDLIIKTQDHSEELIVCKDEPALAVMSTFTGWNMMLKVMMPSAATGGSTRLSAANAWSTILTIEVNDQNRSFVSAQLRLGTIIEGVGPALC